MLGGVSLPSGNVGTKPIPIHVPLNSPKTTFRRTGFFITSHKSNVIFFFFLEDGFLLIALDGVMFFEVWHWRELCSNGSWRLWLVFLSILGNFHDNRDMVLYNLRPGNLVGEMSS